MRLLLKTKTSHKSTAAKYLAAVLVCSGLAAADAQATTLLNPKPEDGTTLFGRAFAVIGDVNGDGLLDLAVGAPYEDGDFPNIDTGFGPPQNVGKVFVISGADFSVLKVLDDPVYQMSQSQKFGGQFGSSVAAAGDLNGDGISEVVVGLPHHVIDEGRDSTFSAGRAYVIDPTTATVLLTLDDPTPEENGRAGFSVASLGDTNSDGKPDFLVGVPGKNVGDEGDVGDEEDGAADVGVAYLYSGADGSILRTINNPFAESDARFGFAVANAGDVDGDGVADALIGAPGKGKVFVFSGKTGATIFTILSPVKEKLASFGSAVAGGMDVDSDGKPDFVVGAPLLKNSQGGVFIFRGSDGTLRRRVRINSPQNNAKVGASVALIPDVTGDGRPDILAGVPEQDVNGLTNAGEVLVIEGNRGRIFQTLTSETPQAFAGFGESVGAADFDNNGGVSPVIGVPYQDADLIDPDDGDLDTHIQIGQIEIQ